MEVLSLLLALLIGISLGMIGGGGSILTVPVLVYVVGMNPEKAITYSLFIVGATAVVGVLDYYRKNLINIRASLIFAVPSFIAVFLTRKFVLPLLPEIFFETGGFEFSRGMFLMLVFALLMLFSAITMIKQTVHFRKLCKDCDEKNFNYRFIFVEGIVVGILTGLVGAGGGFLIIPALVLFAGLPMKMAVGTSLLIIAINSLIGFLTDLVTGMQIDWIFLSAFSCFAFVGILLGSYLSKKTDGNKLRPAFGWVTLAMGIFILIKELILKT